MSAVDTVLLRGMAPRDRRAVILGLAVLAPALLWFAVVRPYRNALEAAEQQVASERALLVREEALIASATALPTAAQSSEDRALRAGLRLIRAPNVPLAEAELTGFLEDIAGLSRVLLQEMRAVEPRRGEELSVTSVQPLRLSVHGESDLEGVLTFLQRVENSPLLLKVVELSIEPEPAADDGTTTGVVKFSMVVEGYTPAKEVSE